MVPITNLMNVHKKNIEYFFEHFKWIYIFKNFSFLFKNLLQFSLFIFYVHRKRKKNQYDFNYGNYRQWPTWINGTFWIFIAVITSPLYFPHFFFLLSIKIFPPHIFCMTIFYKNNNNFWTINETTIANKQTQTTLEI